MKVAVMMALCSAGVLFAEDSTNRLGLSFNGSLVRVMMADRSFTPLKLDGETVRVMEPLPSQTVRAMLPHFTAYRLMSSASSMHYANVTVLLIGSNGVPHHLQTDADVKTFLIEVTALSVQTREDALQAVRLFAGLRCCEIVTERPKAPTAVKADAPLPSPAATDYKFLAVEDEDGWLIHATLRNTRAHDFRYIFRVRRGQLMPLPEGEPVSLTPAARLY